MFVFFEILFFLCYLANLHSSVMNYAFIAITMLALALSLYNIKFGLYIALSELILGSKGYLLYYSTLHFKLSLRIAIFACVMFAWLISEIRNKNLKNIFKPLKDHKEIYFFSGFCLLGLIMAIISKNRLNDIFFDFNGWLYLLYILPFANVFSKYSDFFDKFKKIAVAGLLTLCLKSFVFLFLMSHKFAYVDTLYRYGRDTLFGEFTAGIGFYRIFSQTHIFILIGLIACLTILFLFKKGSLKIYSNKLILALAIILFSVILMSLSRSFWLSAALTGLILIIGAWLLKLAQSKQTGKFLILVLLISVVSAGLISYVVKFPFPEPLSNDALQALSNRFDANEAVSSRQNQIMPLLNKIKLHPILGSGWGTLVTYESFDPRIVTAKNPKGEYTTFAFELGYLDLLLKFGLAGVLSFLYLICQLLIKIKKTAINTTNEFDKYFLLGLLLGLVALTITHAFSPYLNHPLGIGYIIVLYTIIINLKLRPQNPVIH